MSERPCGLLRHSLVSSGLEVPGPTAKVPMAPHMTAHTIAEGRLSYTSCSLAIVEDIGGRKPVAMQPKPLPHDVPQFGDYNTAEADNKAKDELNYVFGGLGSDVFGGFRSGQHQEQALRLHRVRTVHSNRASSGRVCIAAPARILRSCLRTDDRQ